MKWRAMTWLVILPVLLWLPACSGSDESQDAGQDALDGADGGGDPGGDQGGDNGGDGSGGEGPCRFDPNVAWDVLGEILQMQSKDKRTCVWLHRIGKCPEGWICKAVPFELLSVRIGHDGTVIEESEPKNLTWEPTHHNWADKATIHHEGTTYTLQGGGFGDQYDITASGTVSFGPVTLYPYGP
ncbi:MAG: hypothetical protein GYA21_20055 [Myxococcales bacterium]|nr:hypothetical protein [Myxococcales bacterium]